MAGPQQAPHLHLAELTASQFLDVWRHFDADGQSRGAGDPPSHFTHRDEHPRERGRGRDDGESAGIPSRGAQRRRESLCHRSPGKTEGPRGNGEYPRCSPIGKAPGSGEQSAPQDLPVGKGWNPPGAPARGMLSPGVLRVSRGAGSPESWDLLRTGVTSGCCRRVLLFPGCPLPINPYPVPTLCPLQPPASTVPHPLCLGLPRDVWGSAATSLPTGPLHGPAGGG